jgi:hypothetical protein
MHGPEELLASHAMLLAAYPALPTQGRRNATPLLFRLSRLSTGNTAGTSIKAYVISLKVVFPH